MAWAKLDDGFYDNPKVVELPLSAVGLWALAASYCAKHLTGGFISDRSLRRIAPDVDPSSGDRVPESGPDIGSVSEAPLRLVQSGLWYRIKEDQEGYQFHDWDLYNPDSVSAKASREGMADGGREGNHRRWHAKRGKKVEGCEFCFSPSGTDRVPDSPPESVPESSVPSRPDPILIDVSASPPPKQRKKPEVKLPDSWEPTDTHESKAQELNLDLAFEVEQFRNHAIANDRRQVNWNASFTMWLSKSKSFQKPQGSTVADDRYKNPWKYQ